MTMPRLSPAYATSRIETVGGCIEKAPTAHRPSSVTYLSRLRKFEPRCAGEVVAHHAACLDDGGACRHTGRDFESHFTTRRPRRYPLQKRPMTGNTFGFLFTVTTFGESHGPALGAIVDGCPPGMILSASDIQHELDRRKPGTSRHTTQRREPDEIEILSGGFEGKTTKTPNKHDKHNNNQRSKDYTKIAEQFRPGHADY